ncbi:hypothetical protein [Nocardia brasiliensis]|uniref:hypothetical protein n=1 Tax=Nocardia brasiliensis TaxID=37326 RepID=UPI00366B0022
MRSFARVVVLAFAVTVSTAVIYAGSAVADDTDRFLECSEKEDYTGFKDCMSKFGAERKNKASKAAQQRIRELEMPCLHELRGLGEERSGIPKEELKKGEGDACRELKSLDSKAFEEVQQFVKENPGS